MSNEATTTSTDPDVVQELAKAVAFEQLDKATDCMNNPECVQILTGIQLALTSENLDQAKINVITDTLKCFYTAGALSIAQAVAAQETANLKSQPPTT